mmetsp:Transcript_15198/g.22748  ORF Transcript_15198/g.22748 Transcript_15198/m.22748 type:complete len:180 (-) Transcript_15198:222-761(-)
MAEERERQTGNYGTTARPATASGRNPRSIHFRAAHLSTRESTRGNIFTSVRPGSPFSALNADVRKVPTLLKDNVRLFTTEQLDTEGLLYMREEAFYNRTEDPEYALSISPHIYRKMVDEVNDSYSVPMGLYFCCHGGDGAHSGVAHDDNVDIGVAYIFVVFFFVVTMTLGWVLPMPIPH